METVIDAADIKDYADEYCQMHKDAARYRWLRDNCKDGDLRAAFGFIAWGSDDLAAAIDKEIENANS